MKGDKNPVSCRVMAIADVDDAWVSDRIYRKAMLHEEACHIVSEEDGSHFEPRIVEAFREIHEKFSEYRYLD